jgi:hypothetical protein
MMYSAMLLQVRLQANTYLYLQFCCYLIVTVLLSAAADQVRAEQLYLGQPAALGKASCCIPITALQSS